MRSSCIIFAIIGIAATLAVASVVFLYTFTRFRLLFLWFLPPLLFALAGMFVIFLTYDSDAFSEFDRQSQIVASTVTILVTGLALLFFVILWGVICFSKFPVEEEEADGIREPVEGNHEQLTMRSLRLTKSRTFHLTLPLLLFIVCVLATASVTISELDIRLSYAIIIFAVIGIAATLSVASVIFLYTFTRFRLLFLWFLPPLLLALGGMFVIFSTYNSNASSEFDRDNQIVAAFVAILVTSLGLLFSVILWVVICFSKFPVEEEEADGIREPVEGNHEDVNVADV